VFLHPKTLPFFSAVSAGTLEKLSSHPTHVTSWLQENPCYTSKHKQENVSLAVHETVWFTSSDHRRQWRHLGWPPSLWSSDKE